MIIAVNITNSVEELTEEKVVKYLEQYGKVEKIKPIKNYQGNKVAKCSYFLSLYYNSSTEDKKFVKFCVDNNILIQFDAFNM